MVRAENDDGDLAAREILLIAEISIGGHDAIEAGRLGRADQLAIRELAPAAAGRGLDVISRKMLAETARDVLVKQDAGHAAARRR